MSKSPHYQLRSQLPSPQDSNDISSEATPHTRDLPCVSSETSMNAKQSHPVNQEADHQWTQESTLDDRSFPNRPVKETVSSRSEKSFRNGLNQGKMDTAKGTTWDSPTLPYLEAAVPSSPPLSTTSSGHPDSPEGTVLQSHLSRLGPKLRMGQRPPWESPSFDEEAEEASLISRTREISEDYGYTLKPTVSVMGSTYGTDGGKDRYFAGGSLRSSNSGTQALKTFGGRLLKKVRSHAELGGGDFQRRGNQFSGGRETPSFVESTDSLLGAESDGWKSETTLESDSPATPVDGLPIMYEDKTPSNQSSSQFVATPPDPMYAGAHRTQPDGQYNPGPNIHDPESAEWPVTSNSTHRPTVLSHSQNPAKTNPSAVSNFTQPFKNMGSGLGLISLREAQAREESNKAAAASRLQQGGSVNPRKPTTSLPLEKARPLSHISEISTASAYSDFTSTSLTSKGNRRLGAAVPPIPPLWMNTLSEMASPTAKVTVQPQQQQNQSTKMAGFKKQKSGLLRMFEKVSSPAIGSINSGRGAFGSSGPGPSPVGDVMDDNKAAQRLEEAAIIHEPSMIEAQPDQSSPGTPQTPSLASGPVPMSTVPPPSELTHRPFSNASPEQSVLRPALPEETVTLDEETHVTPTPPLSSSTIQAPFPSNVPMTTQSNDSSTQLKLSVASLAPPNLELRPISMDFISGLPATYLTDPSNDSTTNTTSISSFLPDIKISSGRLDVALGFDMTVTSCSNGSIKDMTKKTKAASNEDSSLIETNGGLAANVKVLEDQLENERKQWKLQASELENKIKDLQASLAARPTRCAVCKGSMERTSVGLTLGSTLGPTLGPIFGSITGPISGPTSGPTSRPTSGSTSGPEPGLAFRKQISNMDEGWRVASGGPVGGGDSVLNRGRMIKPAR